jgi:hydroxymethylpyrimidine pyrophosphatase-like HAD family hydrolase
VTISHPRFLEFLAPGVSKLVGVRHLARRARVPLGRVLAIGDQFNDLEMIAGVGHGAAMPTAPDAVRAAARYVARPVGEEGAAQLIEALVLSSPETAARHADALARAHEADLGSAA